MLMLLTNSTQTMEELNNFKLNTNTNKYLKVSNNNIMVKFGILDASKIISNFNDDLRQLNNFIGIIDLYAETLKDTIEINKLIKFVLVTKLVDKKKLVSEETSNSLQSFKLSLGN